MLKPIFYNFDPTEESAVTSYRQRTYTLLMECTINSLEWRNQDPDADYLVLFYLHLPTLLLPGEAPFKEKSTIFDSTLG
jgi:hypothetical protein